MTETLSRAEVTARIKHTVALSGGQARLARKLDVTPGYIGHLLAGKKPGPKICKLIGVQEIRDTYVDLRGGR